MKKQPKPTAAELEALPQRPVLSGDELESLELYLRRLPNLPPARAEELAEIIAPVYAERLMRVCGAARLVAAIGAEHRRQHPLVDADEGAQQKRQRVHHAGLCEG